MPKQLNISMSVTADTSQARKQLQDLQNTLGNLASNSIKNNIGKTMDADIQKAIVSAKQLKDMIAEASNTKTGNLDLSKFSQEIQKSGRSIQQYAQDLSNLGPEGTQAFMQLAQSVAAAEVPMKRTFGLLDQFKTTIANAARWQISSSVIHGLWGAIQGAYGYAQDLNKSLTDIRIVTGQSTEQMAQFAEQANKAAQSLSTSTLAYTDASLIYYQQGLDPEEVAARTETTLKMSNVTGESADEVSSYMTAIWNNFRKGGESLESFADKITALGAATASSSKEIAGGLQQFAAIADTVGLSYDYAATALATVVAQTRQSESTVGNSFRTIFSRLEGLQMGDTLEDGTTLNKYSGALATIGVNIKDQNGELKEMDTILDEIGAKWQTLSRDQQVALAQTVGGVRQYTNLIALFDNWDTFQRNLSVSMEADGTLDEQAKRYEESWLAAQKRVQAAWQAIYQDLIDDKFFIGLLDGITKLLHGLDALIDSVGGLRGVLPAVGALLTTIFAKDLAHGIETAVYNFKVFTGTAQESANEVARSFQGIADKLAENLSSEKYEAQAQVFKDQIDFSIKLRENSDQITEANRQQLMSLNEITKEYGNAYIEAKKLQEETGNKLGDKSVEMMNSAVLSDTSGKKAVDIQSEFQSTKNKFFGKIDDFKVQETALRDFITAAKEGNITLDEQNEKWSIVVGQSVDVANNYQGLYKALEEYSDALKKGTQGENDRAAALERINQILSDTKIQEEGLNSYILDEAKALQINHSNWDIQAKDWVELARLKIEAANATDDATRAELNYQAAVKQGEIEFQRAKNAVKSYSDTIVSTARGLSQLIAGLSALGKALDTLTNKDLELTPLERIQQSIPSILTSLPMLIGGFNNLAKEGTLTGDAIVKVVDIFIKGKAASHTLAGGIGAVTKAFVAFLPKLLAFLGWAALAVGAIIAIKVAWDSWYATTDEGKLKESNKRLEELKEKADKASEAYDKLTSTLEDYKKTQEDINDMAPGLDKTNAVLDENQKILEFLDENDLWDTINENGGLQYDSNGLIKLTEIQQKALTNDLLREKSLQKQAEYQEKINNLQLQANVDYKREYNGPKLNLERTKEIPIYDPSEGKFTGESRKEIYGNQDSTRDFIKILTKAGLGTDATKEQIEKAIDQYASEDEKEDYTAQLDQIMSWLAQMAENPEAFNQLKQDETTLEQTQKAYQQQYAQSAIGQQVYETTDNSMAQQGLFDAFIQLGPDWQEKIQQGIADGSTTLSAAFREAGVDVAQMIAEAEQIEQNNLVDKISTNGGGNNRADVQEWINGLSEDKLKIAAELDIDYDDSLEDVKQKLEDKINNTPVELDTNGLTKKQAEELQEEFEQLTDYITRNAEEIDGLDDHLANCAREASVVARAILRFDDAIQDVTEHYDEWNQALTSGSTQSAAKAAAELQDAYGNLMDMDGSQLSSQFLENTEYLNLMKQAIEGNEDAYNSLLAAAGEDIIAHLELDPADMAAFQSQLEVVKGLMSNFPDLEVGANLDTGNFLEELTNLVNAAGMTAEQATAYLASMGIDAEVTKVPAETEPVTETHNYWVPAEYEPASIPTGGDEEGVGGNFKYYTQKSAGHWSEPEPASHEEESAPTAFTLKVTSAHKSSGGAFKYKNATHGGGGVSPSKGKGGGGGGGGSKKKTTKEHTKPVKNEDRYHDIKERIDDLNKSLTRLNKTEDRIYGKAKLKYMDMEIEKLEDQIKLTDEYIAEIKKYAAIDQANLRGIGMGAEFDENGMLTNYEQVLANITNSYNAAIGAYNGAIDAFNGSAQEDADNEALDNAKKQLDAAKETYDENQKILKQYEDTFNLLQEQVDKRIDQVWALFDMRLKKITFEVEFEINWNERELKYLDWLLENIGDTADKGVDKIANLAQQMNEYADTIEWAKKGIQGIFGLHGINFDFDNADPVALTDQLTDAMHRLNFESQLTEDEANALLDYCDTLMEAIDGIRDKWKAAHDAVNDTWDKWNERLERETDRLENYAKEMDSIKNIIDLTGRKMLNLSTQDIDKMNQSQIENNWAQVESWKAIMEARKASMEEAKYYMENAQTEEVREQWRKSYEQFEDDYNDAHQNYYSAWEETLEKVQDAFEETMDNLGKDYNDAMGDLTLLQEQFARKQEVDHLYLDDYEKYHELNKSSDELRKSLENTNSTMMKSKMNDLLDEMNASMRDGVDISEAQAEIYARRVALLQAEAELLDAQNAKSAVRMTRDNEGNFSYTYTADQDQIDDAEGNFQDKFYEVLDYERQYMEDIQGQMLDMTEQFWSDYYDLCERYKDDSAALEEAVEALVDDYNLKMDFLVAEQEMDMGEMARLRDEDWKDFENLTGKKLANQNDFIDQFKNTIVGRLRPQYQNANDYATQWQKTVEKTTQEGNKAVDKYQSNTEKTFEKAGENIEKYGNKAVEKMGNIAAQSQITKDNVTTMSGQMQIDMGQVMTTAWSLDSAWATVMNNMRTQIQQTVSALYSLLQRLQEVQAQAAATIAAVQAAAQAQAMANMGNSLGNNSGNSGTNTGNKGTNNGTSGQTQTGNGIIYDSRGIPIAYSPGGSSTHTGTGESVGYLTGAGSGGFRSASTYNNTNIPTDVYNTLRKQGWRGATGGMTAAWGPEGKFAMLHEKELVLNKEDTANILNVVDSVRSMVSNFGRNALNDIANAITNSGSLALAGAGSMDQNVHIEANFPNVQSHTEIETALNNLVNSAAQYVNRK